MTIKQQGGIFGRNPTFNDVDIEGNLTTQAIDAGGYSISGGTINGSSFDAAVAGASLNLGVTGNTSVKYIKFNEATDWSIQSNGSSYLRIYSGGSEAARFDGSQNFSMVNGGNVIMASGNGIDFSATSGTGTSELFDDYEEGSLSSLDVQDSSGNSASTSTKRGLYRKIGNMVFVSAEIYNVNTSGLTAGNQLRVYGLPYTAAAAGHTSYGAVQLNDFTLIGSAGTFVQNVQGTDYVRLQMNTLAAGGAESVIVSDAASGTADIFFSIAYPTD